MDSSSGSQGKNSKTSDGCETKEVNNTAQNFVHFTEEEEDLVFRMHKLVGNSSLTLLLVGTYSWKNPWKNSKRSRNVLGSKAPEYIRGGKAVH
uniref:Uncharacterized protein n=1 Tax=Oryza meridionalis TaxID=40149 RepID=A0A0E0C4Q4_9ORYZ